MRNAASLNMSYVINLLLSLTSCCISSLVFSITSFRVSVSANFLFIHIENKGVIFEPNIQHLWILFLKPNEIVLFIFNIHKLNNS